MHRIGAIERHDLRRRRRPRSTTYRSALEDDAGRRRRARGARGALRAGRALGRTCARLLEERLARAEGDARAIAARPAGARSRRSHGDEDRARAQCARLLEDAELAPEHLDAVEHAAERLGDATWRAPSCCRRAEMTQDPREQIAWLDRLGDLDETRLGDLEPRGGGLEASGGARRGRRRTTRPRGGSTGARARRAPEDREVTARLVALCERAELCAELPRALRGAGRAGRSTPSGRADLALKTAQVLSRAARRCAGGGRGVRGARLRARARARRRSGDVREAQRRGGHGSSSLRARASIEDAARRDARRRPVDARSRARAQLARCARARALAADPGAGRRRRARVPGHPRRRRARPSAPGASALAALRGARRARSGVAAAARRPPVAARVARGARAGGRARRAPARVGRAGGDDVRRPGAARSRCTGACSPSTRECDEALAAVARLALATGDTEDALDGAARAARSGRGAGAHRDRAGDRAGAAGADDALGRGARRAAGGARTTRRESRRRAALATQLLAHRATRAEAIAMLEQACDAARRRAGSHVERRRAARSRTRLLDAPASRRREPRRRGEARRRPGGPRASGSSG